MKLFQEFHALDSKGTQVTASLFVGTGNRPIYYAECGARSYTGRDLQVARREAEKLLKAECMARFVVVPQVAKELS